MTFDPNAANAATCDRMKGAFIEEMKADRKPMTFTSGLLAGVMRMLGLATADAAAHYAALEKRVDALERQQKEQKGLQYRGVWRSSETYRAGDAITWKGSLWICRASATTEPPADAAGSGSWQLAVRKGRDGRNADRGAHNDDN